MKREIITLLLLGLAVGGFALEISTGLGAALDFTSNDLKFVQSGVSMEDYESQEPLEIKAFLDVTYLQISVGYMAVNGGNGTLTVGGSSGTVNEPMLKASYVTFAAYGKYPLRSSHDKFFPLIGVEYRLNLQYTDALGNDKSSYFGQAQSDMNELWLEAGIGAEFAIRRFYFGPEVLIGFKPLSTTDNNGLSALQAIGYTSTTLSYFTINISLLAGFELSPLEETR